ncbi:hypothetical protein [Atlantibacter sp.]|nr:hypothetical protein [Atlantibacter sp.]
MMKNAYRIYQTTLNGPRLFMGDVCLLMELWEKMQQVFAGGIPH